jgi:hypothetical protein
MAKNIIITCLLVIGTLQGIQLYRYDRVQPPLAGAKYIDWPEELAPTLQAYKKVSHKMSFELVGDTLIVGFDNSGKIAPAEKDQ